MVAIDYARATTAPTITAATITRISTTASAVVSNGTVMVVVYVWVIFNCGRAITIVVYR